MRKLLLVLVAVSLATFLAGCGGQSAEEKRADKDKEVAAAAKKKEAERQELIGETGELCDELVSDFREKLEDLNSRLGVGIKPDDYSNRVGDIRVAYDKVEWDDTPNVYCLQKVGVPLETAMNDFVKAGATWGDCISDFDCDVEKDKLPGMQKKWTHAGKMIEKSNAALEDFQLDE